VNLINNTFDCICNEQKCLSSEFQQHTIKTELSSKSSSDQQHSVINQPNSIHTLDFFGESYIKFKSLLTNVARAFSTELWFMSRSSNGLLIYAQKNKKGDFLSLNIKDCRLEFIFDLGSKVPNVSGVVKIRSDVSITLNYWHKVRIARLDDYATMQIDDGVVYSDQAKVIRNFNNYG
jgi:hypothetical protein